MNFYNFFSQFFAIKKTLILNSMNANIMDFNCLPDYHELLLFQQNVNMAVDLSSGFLYVEQIILYSVRSRIRKEMVNICATVYSPFLVLLDGSGPFSLQNALQINFEVKKMLFIQSINFFLFIFFFVFK